MCPLLVLLLFAGAATARAEPPLFVEIPGHAVAVDGGPSRGVAFGDGDADLLVANTINYAEFLYRNDGVLDIFAARVNGVNSLYRNEGDWTFVEQEVGDLSSDHSSSSMACWADLDSDGWLDVFVVIRGGKIDALYRNLEGRSFERIDNNVASRAAGDGRSCVFADLNGDRIPELYVGNYVDSSTETPTKQRNYLFIDWPSGQCDTLEDVTANQHLRFSEGET